MRCAESLRVQAYFDGELDAITAADIERHVEHCAECRALLGELGQVRGALRKEAAYVRVPPALQARIVDALDALDALDAEDAASAVSPLAAASRASGSAYGLAVINPTRRARRSFWMGAFSGMGGAAIAAALAVFLVMPSINNPMLDDVVDAHVRSLMPEHLIDVVSTDRHTVKPWFAGHADVSPVVADFEPQGYRLVGGRADYLDRQRAAVVVYQHGAHTINVFSWAADSRWGVGGSALSKNTTRNGYHLAFWKVGNLQYCAVSDTGWEELQRLVGLLRDLGAQEINPVKE